MNNMLKGLLVTALAISASHVSAATNQGFLSVPRAQKASLLLDSAIAHDLEKTNHKDRLGGNLMVRGYYSQSTNKKALGQYFGINNSDSFKAAWGASTNANINGTMVNAGYLVHDSNAALGNYPPGVAGAGNAVVAPVANNGIFLALDTNAAGLAATVAAIAAAPIKNVATITFAPQTTSYGLELGYVQCLSKIVDGLHLSISLPIEKVENNMNLAVTGGANANDASALTQFFAGSLAAAQTAGYLNAGANMSGQGQLTKGLIKGVQSATGIADIDVAVGYDFLREENWTAGLNIAMSIPTGNTPTGQYLFEPIYGNGGHFELGLGGRVAGKLWHEGDQHIGLSVQADYRYGFKANETRTLSITKVGIADNLNQYYLVNKVNSAITAEAPFANSFTLPVSVTPNSAVRGNLGLNYGNGGFVFGLAYAPSWKQAESVSVAATVAAATGVMAPQAGSLSVVDDAVGTTFGGAGGLIAAGNAGVATLDAAATAGTQIPTVGVPAQSANTLAVAVAASTANPTLPNNVTTFAAADVNANSSLRGSQLGHRIGGDMGYTFKNWEFPVTIGAGAHYEFANSNAVAENWGAHLTAGIGF